MLHEVSHLQEIKSEIAYHRDKVRCLENRSERLLQEIAGRFRRAYAARE